MPLATKASRDFDLDTASAYNSELVKAKLNTMRILGLSGLAFATLRSHQLQAPLALFGKEPTEEKEPKRTQPTNGRRPEDQPTARRRAVRSRTQEAKRPKGP